MGYAVLWISYLATGILLIALNVALFARCKRTFWQRRLPWLVMLVLLFCSALITLILGLVWGQIIRPLWLFPYALALSVLFVVGAFIVLRRGLGKKGEEPGGRTWPRARLATALGLVLSINIGTYLFMDFAIRMKMTDLYAEATARAVTVLPPKLPESQDAARIYKQIAEKFTGRPFYTRPGERVDFQKMKNIPLWFRFDIDEPDFNPKSPQVARFLLANRELLVLLHQATQLPGVNHDIRMDAILFSAIPEYDAFSNFAKLLVLAAKFKITEGDPQGAINNLDAIERMSEHLLRTNSLYYRADELERIKIDGLEYVLAHTPPTERMLIETPVKRSSSVKHHYLNTFSMKEAAILQFVASFGMDTLGAMKRFHEFVDMGTTPPVFFQFLHLNRLEWMNNPVSQFWRVFFTPVDLDTIPDGWAKARELASRPYPQLEKDLRAREKSDEAKPHSPLYICHIDTSGMFSLGFMILQLSRMEASRGLTDLALAATAYRTTQGHYPSSLGDLIPDYIGEIPIDPYDGKQLKMGILDGGLDLYSVGPVSIRTEEKRYPIHFYLGKQAYEKYRVEPAKKIRAEREAKKKEREKQGRKGKKLKRRPKKRK